MTAGDQNELFLYAVERLEATLSARNLPCKICGAESIPFGTLDFNISCETRRAPHKLSLIPVVYRSCNHCGFIFTDFFDVFTNDQWRTPEPTGSLQAIFEKVSPDRLIIMISTVVSNGAIDGQARLNWWCAAARNGHIFLYLWRLIQILTSHVGLTPTLIGSGPYFLTRGNHTRETARVMVCGKLVRRLRRHISMSWLDWNSFSGTP